MPKAKPQQSIELSKADHGVLMAKALIAGMIENPDEILRTKGGGRFDVYRDLLRDDQVKSVFQQRRTAVVQAPWEVEPASDTPQDKEIAEFVREQLTRISFDQLTDKMLYAVHYGYSVAEIMWAYDNKTQKIIIDKIKVRDRSRFKFGPDGELLLVKGLKNELMPPEKFWVFSVGADHDDNPYGEGLAHSLYWPVFFKRNGIKFWLIFLEKFGMPTAMAKLSQAQIKDPYQRQLALQVLDAIQADSGVLVPEDFVVELIEASRSGTADYSTLKAHMDASIAKIILSQTMTTDNGSSRSQAEVHEGVKNDVIKTDADLICDSFTQQVVKQLVAQNFDGADIPKVWRRTEPETDLVQLAERDNKIMALGFEPTEEYVAETYGPGWRKKETVIPPIGGGPVGTLPPMGAEFAEVSALTDKRILHRRDQQALTDAAEYLGTKYRDIYGKRINQLLSYLEETSDVETFRQRLKDMMAEPVPEQTAEFIENATWFARLMGFFKGRRA